MSHESVIERIAELAPRIPPDPDGLLVARAALERGTGAEPAPQAPRRAPWGRLVAAVAAAGVAVVGVVVVTGQHDPGTSVASVATFTDPDQLARASEYLVRGTVLDSPSVATRTQDAAAHYAVVHVAVAEVLGARPDAPVDLADGETITVGFAVAEQSDEFASPDDVPAVGSEVLGFLVASTLGSAGPAFEAVGSATVDPTSGDATFATVVGPLHDQSLPVSSLVDEDFVGQFDAPAPWRSAGAR